jgi:hypothetical protein
MRSDRLIQTAERRSRPYRRGTGLWINGNRIHQPHVDDDTCALREAFVGMAAASDGERKVIAAAPIDHDANSLGRLAERA